jgi:hypothetical protein
VYASTVVVLHRKADAGATRPAPEDYLYRKGKMSNTCMLILSGTVEICEEDGNTYNVTDSYDKANQSSNSNSNSSSGSGSGGGSSVGQVEAVSSDVVSSSTAAVRVLGGGGGGGSGGGAGTNSSASTGAGAGVGSSTTVQNLLEFPEDEVAPAADAVDAPRFNITGSDARTTGCSDASGLAQSPPPPPPSSSLPPLPPNSHSAHPTQQHHQHQQHLHTQVPSPAAAPAPAQPQTHAAAAARRKGPWCTLAPEVLEAPEGTYIPRFSAYISSDEVRILRLTNIPLDPTLPSPAAAVGPPPPPPPPLSPALTASPGTSAIAGAAAGAGIKHIVGNHYYKSRSHMSMNNMAYTANTSSATASGAGAGAGAGTAPTGGAVYSPFAAAQSAVSNARSASPSMSDRKKAVSGTTKLVAYPSTQQSSSGSSGNNSSNVNRNSGLTKKSSLEIHSTYSSSAHSNTSRSNNTSSSSSTPTGVGARYSPLHKNIYPSDNEEATDDQV